LRPGDQISIVAVLVIVAIMIFIAVMFLYFPPKNGQSQSRFEPNFSGQYEINTTYVPNLATTDKIQTRGVPNMLNDSQETIVITPKYVPPILPVPNQTMTMTINNTNTSTNTTT
jgi:hypothetical protein